MSKKFEMDSINKNNTLFINSKKIIDRELEKDT